MTRSGRNTPLYFHNTPSKVLHFNLTFGQNECIIIYCEFEPLAQLVEHLTFNQVVTGSTPVRLIHFFFYMPPSSSLAKDTALSRRRHEFKSRRGYFPKKKPNPSTVGWVSLFIVKLINLYNFSRFNWRIGKSQSAASASSNNTGDSTRIASLIQTSSQSLQPTQSFGFTSSQIPKKLSACSFVTGSIISRHSQGHI